MKRLAAYARGALRRLRKGGLGYSPLIEVRVSREAILHNFRAFQKLSEKVAVAPVVKANAYGHGLVRVARMLEGEWPPFFCVDSYFEALALRNEGISTPILLIGYTPLENIAAHGLKDVSFAMIGMDELRRLAERIDRPTKIHLKVDTGMHRHGIMPGELDEAIALIRANKKIALDGVYSHFADADTPNSPHAASQIARWNAAAAKVREKFPGVRYFHCAATSGSFYAGELDANVMRLGIGLYGVNASLAQVELYPALEVRTRITSLRTLSPGERVGYNATFEAKKEMRVASIPAGYNEGVDRRLSNIGSMLVRGLACPIIGRVSMNITSLDVSAIPDVRLDEEVVVVSAERSAPNSVENIARQCGTIPYEILVHIPAHLRRVVV